MGDNVLKLIGSGCVAVLLGTTATFAAMPAGAAAPATQAPAARIVVAAAAASSDSDIVTLAPPAKSPYLWSATKSADGTLAFAGYVPSQDVRDLLVDTVRKMGADTMSFAGGQPDDFAADAVAALGVLDGLDSGKVSFDGSSWSVSGTVDSADKAAAASAAFATSPLKDLGAAYDVNGPAAASAAHPDSAPAPQTTAAAPTAIAPAATVGYSWFADKAADGTITFAGSVPDANLKAFLARHVHGKLVDNSVVASGAPDLFLSDVVSALDALTTLDTGTLGFTNGKWTLAGVAKDATADKAATSDLSLVDPKSWKIDITTTPNSVASTPAASPATPTPAKPAAPAAAIAPVPAAPATSPAKPVVPAQVTAPAPAASATTPTASAPTPAGAVASPAAAPAAYEFSATKSSAGAITLSGDVPNDAVKDNIGSIAGGVSTDALKVVGDPPANFINGAVGGLGVLAKLDSGQLSFEGGKWSLKGSAPTPDLHDSILASIADLPGGKDWTTDIAGPPPLVACRAKLADVLKVGSAINFDKGTHFAKGTDTALDSIAAALALCPDARVDISGNTDSDGDANANMALSVARAEAVSEALVKRGIKAERLYAIGYGETLPLVPNTTKANKAKNRRIEFKVEDTGK